MQYRCCYSSPLGELLLTADELGLNGVWFVGQKHFEPCQSRNFEEKETPLLKRTRQWLTIYFSGKEPYFTVPFHFQGTEFQKEVWEILCTIPYGQTRTYGELARQVADRRGLAHMSAQAIGGAVGHNKISILVPCHRVVGKNGSLTGYAAGIEKKRRLLELERAEKEAAGSRILLR